MKFVEWGAERKTIQRENPRVEKGWVT